MGIIRAINTEANQKDNAMTERDTKKVDDGRRKALDAALTQIERQFGKGAVMRMNAGDVMRDIDTISSGSISLDTALGIGGFPRGRVVEIYGRNCQARPPLRCTSSPKRRRPAASPPSSTPSMRSTPPTPRSWG